LTQSSIKTKGKQVVDSATRQGKTEGIR